MLNRKQQEILKEARELVNNDLIYSLYIKALHIHQAEALGPDRLADLQYQIFLLLRSSMSLHALFTLLEVDEIHAHDFIPTHVKLIISTLPLLQSQTRRLNLLLEAAEADLRKMGKEFLDATSQREAEEGYARRSGR